MKNLVRMRILSIALSLAVMLSMMPMAGIFVYADDESAPVQQVDGESGQSAPVQQVGGEDGQSAPVQQAGGENGQAPVQGAQPDGAEGENGQAAPVQQAGGENGQAPVQGAQPDGAEGENGQSAPVQQGGGENGQAAPVQQAGGENGQSPVQGAQPDGSEGTQPEGGVVQMLLKAINPELIPMLKQTDITEVTSSDEFWQAIKDGAEKIELKNSFEVPSDRKACLLTHDLDINLGGNTLTLNTTTASIVVGTGCALKLHDGDITAKNMMLYDKSKKQSFLRGTSSVYSALKDAKITVDSITMDTNGTAFFPNGDAAALIVEDSTIKAGTYCAGTNRTTEQSGIKITFRDCTLSTSGYETGKNDGDDAAIMSNQDGAKITIDGGSITSHKMAVFVRAGSADIKNVKINFDGKYKYYDYYTDGSKWSTGNEGIAGAVVVGDKASPFKDKKGNPVNDPYSGDASVTLENVTIDANGKRAIVVSDDDNTTSEVIVKSGTIKGDLFTNQNTGTIKINGGFFTDDPSRYVEAGHTVGMLVADEKAYRTAVKSDKIDKIKFAGNITIPEGEQRHVLTRDLDIDLNKNTLTLNSTCASIKVGTGCALSLHDGKIEAHNMRDREGNLSGASSVYSALENASINVKNLTMKTNGTAFFPYIAGASVTIEDSDITGGGYCVGTNRSSTQKNIKVNLKNSNFKTTGDGDAAIMINQPGILTIEGGSITANRIAVLVRTGTANIKNVSITLADTCNDYDAYVDGSKWGDGANGIAGAVVVGDKSSPFENKNGKLLNDPYSGDAKVTLEKVTIDVNGKRAIVVSDDDNTTSEVIVKSGTITGDLYRNQDTGTITIQGGTFTADPAAYVSNFYSVTENEGKYTVEAKPSFEAKTADELLEAVKHQIPSITLAAAENEQNAEFTLNKPLIVKHNLKLDLNGRNLIFVKESVKDAGAKSNTVTTGCALEIYNGKITASEIEDGIHSAFTGQADSTIKAHDIEMVTNGTAFFPNGDATLLSVENSKVTAGTYCVGTNAATKKVGIVINLKNTEFESTGYAFDKTTGKMDGDDATIMINQPGTLNMDGCKITCHRIGVFARAGQVNLKGVQIDFDGSYKKYDVDYMNGENWKSGNEAISAALVAGDNTPNIYKDPSNVVLENVTINAGDKRAIVVSQDEDATATLTVKSGTVNGTFYRNNDTGTIVVQGGTFTADPAAYVSTAYNVNKNAAGNFVVTAKPSSSGGGGGGGGAVTNITDPNTPLADKTPINETAVIKTDESGKQVADVKISEEAAKKAAEQHQPVEIVVPKTENGAVPEININLPATSKKVAVKIPAAQLTETTVLMKVNEDGTMTPVPTSVISEENDGIIANVENGTYVLVDNKVEFHDVNSNDWFSKGVNFVASRGLMEGVGGDTFAQDKTLTKAETQTVLSRLDGMDKQESWTKAVEKYGQTEICDRQNTVAMLYEAYKETKGENLVKPNMEVLSQFSDMGDVSPEFAEALCWAIESKLIQGMGDGTVNPLGDLTRGQFSTMIERYAKLISL